MKTGWTYEDFKIEARGGMIIHHPIWRTKKSFKLMNPGVKPKKIKLEVSDEN